MSSRRQRSIPLGGRYRQVHCKSKIWLSYIHLSCKFVKFWVIQIWFTTSTANLHQWIHHSPLCITNPWWSEISTDWWISLTEVQWCGKCVLFHGIFIIVKDCTRQGVRLLVMFCHLRLKYDNQFHAGMNTQASHSCLHCGITPYL